MKEDETACKVIEACCIYTYTTLDEVLGRSRKENIANARCVFAYIMNHHFGYTKAQIEKLILRDHSTVISMINRVLECKPSTDKKLHTTLRMVENEIYGMF